MKTQVSLSIVFLFLFTNAYNQQFSYGIKGGLDIIDFIFVSNFDEGFGPRKSFDLGVVLNYKIVKKIEIQIEPGFIEKGSQIVAKWNRWIFNYGYINTPIILIVKPIKRFNIEIGTELGSVVYAKEKLEPLGYLKDINKQAFTKFEISGLIGLSYNLFTKVYLVVRYSQGITSLQDGADPVDPGPNEPYRIFNKYTQFGIRFMINKQKDKPVSVKGINSCPGEEVRRSYNKQLLKR
jgi:hypothetical protein